MEHLSDLQRTKEALTNTLQEASEEEKKKQEDRKKRDDERRKRLKGVILQEVEKIEKKLETLEQTPELMHVTKRRYFIYFITLLLLILLSSLLIKK